MKIPFLKLTLGAEEKRAINDVIDSGWVVMGKKTQEFEEKFAEYVGAKYAVFVDSGTSALFLALRAINKFDTVIIPSLTFTSTAEVIIHTGATPIFHDVRRDTFVMHAGVANIYSIPVHLMGNKCHFRSLIYDSAHRIQKGDVKNSEAMWCYSFYATKNITTVQGGMIATNNKDQDEWLRKARDHGISKGTQERYEKGDWEYSVDFVGWRMKGDDLRAAIGIEQLKKIDWINAERQRVVERYNSHLGLERTGNHIYPVLVDKRPDFVNFMRDRSIQTSVHFLPLHKMPAYQHYPHEDLTNTEYLGERLVSLPLYPQLTNEEIDEVCKAVKDSKLLIHE